MVEECAETSTRGTAGKEPIAERAQRECQQLQQLQQLFLPVGFSISISFPLALTITTKTWSRKELHTISRSFQESWSKRQLLLPLALTV
jgi:hypothetical protein